MQFEIENQTYFWIVPDEGRWYVFSPRKTESSDSGGHGRRTVRELCVAPDEEKKRIVH